MRWIGTHPTTIINAAVNAGFIAGNSTAFGVLTLQVPGDNATYARSSNGSKSMGSPQLSPPGKTTEHSLTPTRSASIGKKFDVVSMPQSWSPGFSGFGNSVEIRISQPVISPLLSVATPIIRGKEAFAELMIFRPSVNSNSKISSEIYSDGIDGTNGFSNTK